MALGIVMGATLLPQIDRRRQARDLRRNGAGVCAAVETSLAGRSAAWHHLRMRRRSVAQDDLTAKRTRIAAQTADERVDRALELGRRDVEIFAEAAGIDPRTARILIERRRQARRRASSCMDALLG